MKQDIDNIKKLLDSAIKAGLFRDSETVEVLAGSIRKLSSLVEQVEFNEELLKQGENMHK